MGIIIICAIIGFLLMFFDWEEFGMALMGGILGGLIGIIVWFILGGIIGCNLQTVETIEEQEILALNDSSSIEGASYLFSGYIDEDLVCRYVINTERGKHIEEVNTKNVYINEGDYEPTVKIHTTHFKKDWYYWFAHDLFSSEYYVEFFVPENTVTSEYNIDLK